MFPGASERVLNPRIPLALRLTLPALPSFVDSQTERTLAFAAVASPNGGSASHKHSQRAPTRATLRLDDSAQLIALHSLRQITRARSVRSATLIHLSLQPTG